MPFQLRPYQAESIAGAQEAWAEGHKWVAIVLPTGAGKTVTFSELIRINKGAVCAIAHRQELVSQISLALARDGVRHKIIGPTNVVKLCVNLHMAELNQSYYDPSSSVAVAGVDTLLRRGDSIKQWAQSVTLCVQDECHHILKDNKWGKAAEMFPNARGLGVTATPLRADGKGLSRETDGLFDTMLVGPSMRDLINMGFLTDYRIFAPRTNIDLSDVNVGASGDFVMRGSHGLVNAVHRSKVVGDIVQHYQRIAPGKLGVTFTTDVETATTVAAQFTAFGVPSEVVHAKTPDKDRIAALARFKRREILQLVNVDLFGEGFDLPAIEVVSMARPTESYGLYVQQFGRALRLLGGKTEAIIIDHVGNVERHGLPDAPREWSLGRRESRGGSQTKIMIKVCPSCTSVYERFLPVCPFCGVRPVPAERSRPEHVDGDLTELDPAMLAMMRGEVARVDMDQEEYREELRRKGAPAIGQMAHVKRHAQRQEAQAALREAVAWWAGYQRAKGREDAESYRRFFLEFGVDVMSAQALNTAEAEDLNSRLTKYLTEKEGHYVPTL